MLKSKKRVRGVQQNDQGQFLGGLRDALRDGRDLLQAGSEFVSALVDGARLVKDSDLGGMFQGFVQGIGGISEESQQQKQQVPTSNTSMPLEMAYGVLGVLPEATDDEIKSKYKSMSRKVHPDKGGSQQLQTLLNQAYRVVKESRENKQK